MRSTFRGYRMRIDIEFDSIWQNSFLEPEKKGYPFSKSNKSLFIATSKSLDNNYKIEPITKNTVMGVLCRLIGDQRRLHQARESADYYFKDIENFNLIDFNFKVIPRKNTISNEVVYLRNKKTDTFRQNFSGVIDDDAGLFFSENAHHLWSILNFKIAELLDFINQEQAHLCEQRKVSPIHLLITIEGIRSLPVIKTIELQLQDIQKKIDANNKKLIENQKKILSALENEKKIKTLKNNNKNLLKRNDELSKEISKIRSSQEAKIIERKLNKSLKKLEEIFPEITYLNKGRVFPISLYSASLYIQKDRLEREGYNISPLINRNKIIQGFSKRGFNGRRDFLSNYSSGGKARNLGAPYKTKNGNALKKVSGRLEIEISLRKEKALELKTMIENAGVSSFYLGKKGLAYVSKIRI